MLVYRLLLMAGETLMKRYLMTLALMATFVFAASSVMAQDRHGNNGRRGRTVQSNVIDWNVLHRNQGKWRKKNANGYRNYGQYRRTQVGSRRSHHVRRYYYTDGKRLSRMVRVYY